MQWDLASDRPVYTQLAEQIKLRIVLGAYAPGEKLPGVRDLAGEAAVNPNTMQRALAVLEQEGLLITQRTSGKFVTEDMQLIVETKKNLARQEVGTFIARMERLGYTPAEAEALFKQLIEGIEEEKDE